MKHALALRAAVQPWKEHCGLAPLLLYVYAEPDTWPGTGSQIGEDAKAHHREEIASFADHVADDEVAFSACLHGSTHPATGQMPALPYASAVGEHPPAEGSYRQLLDVWRRSPDQGVARHAEAVIDRFAP